MQYATTHATITPMARRTGQLPVWNRYKFQCPNCQRSFPPTTIRLKRFNGEYVCHRCHDHLTDNLDHTRTPTTRIEPTPELANTLCANCKQPLTTRRRIILNTHQQLVHYRCP